MLGLRLRVHFTHDSSQGASAESQTVQSTNYRRKWSYSILGAGGGGSALATTQWTVYPACNSHTCALCSLVVSQSHLYYLFVSCSWLLYCVPPNVTANQNGTCGNCTS